MKPGPQVGEPTAAPVLLLPELSARLVPLPSLRFQTPSSPVCGLVISVSLLAWICASVWALSQIRTSSMLPAKKPAAVPVVVRALPIEVSALVAALAGLPMLRLPASAPSR